MPELSVIIPLSPNETSWHNLLPDLAPLPNGTEIILMTSHNKKIQLPNLPQKKLKIIKTKSGRAHQMNQGARIAKGKYLWFLHADSRFGEKTLSALYRAIKNHPNNLFYFDLAFLNDTSPLMFLNSWGVRFRSRFFKIPFGDQGFCIKKKLFHQLSGFPENQPYGEDHLFVWKARQGGIAIQPVHATLYTSARKYKKNGWLKTTAIHQYLWIKQALPEWKKLKKIK